MDNDCKRRHRRTKRYDFGGPMVSADVRLDRSFHDPPLAHAKLIALALFIGRFHGSIKDVVAQGLVVGIPLAGAWGFKNRHIQSFISEESLVSSNQERQIMDGIHHRRRYSPETSDCSTHQFF